VVVAPVVWPIHRSAVFGQLALKDVDLVLSFLPTRKIACDLNYRNGGKTHVESCLINFPNLGNKGKKFFKIAVSWGSGKVTIAAGGKIIGSTEGGIEIEEMPITLKEVAEVKDVEPGSPDGAVLMCTGDIGPVPNELLGVKEEIERAARYLKRMEEATHLIAISDWWKAYLDTFVKVRNKIIGATKQLAGDEQKAGSWSGQYEKKIRDSDLLSYVLHARNADNHGLQAIVTQLDGKLGITSDGVTTIKTLVVTKKGIEVTFEGSPPNLSIVPGCVFAVPVTDSGEVYSPPKGNVGLFQLAQGSLAFLEQWVGDTVKKFG